MAAWGRVGHFCRLDGEDEPISHAAANRSEPDELNRVCTYQRRHAIRPRVSWVLSTRAKALAL